MLVYEETLDDIHCKKIKIKIKIKALWN